MSASSQSFTNLVTLNPIYPPGSTGGMIISWSPLLGTVAVIATAILARHAYKEAKAGWIHFSIMAWAVLAPAWFTCEYFFIYHVYGRPEAFELFKHGQQLAAAVWAGMVASLIALASSSRFKDEPKDAKRSPK